MSTLRQKNRTLFLALMLLVSGMVGLAYASVPLYRLFCQVTGFGGTPQIARNATAPGAVAALPPIRIQFNADTGMELPWTFAPEQQSVEIRAGEEKLIAYRATNLSDHAVTGTAVFNVSPPEVGSYFVKLQCFCFEKQTLQPGQSLDFPVLFYVDPAIADDPETADTREITLSYTFYPSDKAPLEENGR